MRRASGLFALLTCLYLLTLGGHLYSPDEIVLFRVTKALATEGSLLIEPYDKIDGFSTRPANPPREDGREYAQYGVGQPLVAIPFYYLGRALQPLADDMAWMALDERMRTIPTVVSQGSVALPSDDEIANAAQDVAARLGLSLFNTLVTALSGVLIFLLAQRLCGSPRAAWVAALLWGTGSMAWPHARTFFTEPLAGFCLLLSLTLLAYYFYPGQVEDTDDDSTRSSYGHALLPLLAGLAACYGWLVRLDSVVFFPAIFLIVGWNDFDVPRRENESAAQWLARFFGHLKSGDKTAGKPGVIRRLILFTLPAFLAVGVILAINKMQFGSLFASGYSDQTEGIKFSTPILAGLYGFLMSIGKGMFFFSPILVLSFFGLKPMLKKRPVFGGGILLIFVLFLCVMSKWQNWAGGWCWGPRHIMQIHALLAIPIAFWLATPRWALRRAIVAGLMVVSMAVQVYGCSQSFFEFYHIFYRDPEPPNARYLESTMQAWMLDGRFAVVERDPATGEIKREIHPAFIPLRAPINDSIYIVQNSQWPGYAQLWRERKTHDFFWGHLFNQ